MIQGPHAIFSEIESAAFTLGSSPHADKMFTVNLLEPAIASSSYLANISCVCHMLMNRIKDLERGISRTWWGKSPLLSRRSSHDKKNNG